MKMTNVNYVVDVLLAVCLVVVAVTGLAVFLFMPEGVRQGGLQEFVGVQKTVWTSVHNWTGILMVALMLVHFILHWNWLVCMTRNVFSRKPKECKI